MDLFDWQMSQWQFWLQQRQRRAQAYLLTGSDGIGLTAFLQAAAQSLLCCHPQASGEACGQCPQCHLFAQHVHPDYFKVAILEDKKEISIDQIRALNQQLFETAHQGGFKVAVIEQAEKLNANAFNALLKSIEEPPENTVILLSSYQPSLLPATIKSRCQQMRFAKPSLEEATAWLQSAFPALEVPLIKKALKINWGAPLRAKQWLEEQAYDIETAWQQHLTDLLSGQLTTVKAVEYWKKFPQPEVVFDYFYLWSVNRVRASLYQQKWPFQANWMTFQQTTLQAKQAWLRNGNKDLVLEALCFEWLALNDMSNKASNQTFTQTFNQPSNQSSNQPSQHSAFQSPLLRGQL